MYQNVILLIGKWSIHFGLPTINFQNSFFFVRSEDPRRSALKSSFPSLNPRIRYIFKLQQSEDLFTG